MDISKFLKKKKIGEKMILRILEDSITKSYSLRPTIPCPFLLDKFDDKQF